MSIFPPDTTQLDLARAYLHSGEYLQFRDFHLVRCRRPLSPARREFIQRMYLCNLERGAEKLCSDILSQPNAAGTATGRSRGPERIMSEQIQSGAASPAQMKEAGEGVAGSRRDGRVSQPAMGARPRIRSIATGRTGIGIRRYHDGSWGVRWDDRPSLWGEFGSHERVPGHLLEVMNA